MNDVVDSQGDSGGPIFQYDINGDPVVVGTVSFGPKCGSPEPPGVYARTSAHTSLFQGKAGIVTVTNTKSIMSDFRPPRSLKSIIILVGAVVVAVVVAVVMLSWGGTRLVRRRRNMRNSQAQNAHLPVHSIQRPPAVVQPLPVQNDYRFAHPATAEPIYRQTTSDPAPAIERGAALPQVAERTEGAEAIVNSGAVEMFNGENNSAVLFATYDPYERVSGGGFRNNNVGSGPGNITK